MPRLDRRIAGGRRQLDVVKDVLAIQLPVLLSTHEYTCIYVYISRSTYLYMYIYAVAHMHIQVYNLSVHLSTYLS